LFTGKAYDGPPVDVFAMGVCLFMLVEHSFPFIDLNDIWHRRLIKSPSGYCQARGKNMDLSFLKLVAGMLEPSPAKRLTVKQCLESEWMQG
jgi:serine/threonine protein kinase